MTKADSKFLVQLKAARNTSTPIVAIRTADPAATMNMITNMTKPPIDIEDTKHLSWDVVRGLVPIDNEVPEGEIGKSDIMLREVLQAIGADQAITVSFVEAMNVMAHTPENTVLFVQNSHYLFKEPMNVQAIWNLRDQLKQNFRMLILLGTEFNLPGALEQDVVVLDEPLPDDEELSQLVRECYENNKLGKPKGDVIDRAIPALRGMSAFAAEGCLAMSITKSGIDFERLRDRQYQQIENTRALRVHRGTTTFADIEGNDALKDLLRGVCTGPKKLEVLAILDEIEKMFAGVGSDSSGTTQKQHKEFLTFCQENDVFMVVANGAPGAGKTATFEACAKEFEVMTLKLDLDAAESKYVGESGEFTRAAFKRVKACGKRIGFLCTSNNLKGMPAEMLRRMKVKFFVDLPTKKAQAKLWAMYMKKFNVPQQPLPDHDGWTGAEIKNCCELADTLGKKLTETAKFIVPVCKADAVRLDEIRQQAHNTFTDAEKGGEYVYEKNTTINKTITNKRTVALGA